MSVANNCTFFGRVTKDIELKISQAGKPSARFNIAVTRSYKNQSGTYDADFINCIMFGKRAETLAKYFHKGSRIMVSGEWHTGSYEREGQKVYTNECWVSEFSFVDSAKDNENNAPASNAPENNAPASGSLEEFTSVVNSPLEELPFT